MHHAEKTVTIYRKRWDSEKGLDVYEGTVIPNVSFFSRIATVVSTDGLAAACEGILRIPKAEYGDHLLVLKAGDLVCEGELPVAGQTPEELDKQCPYVFTVVGVTKNLTGREPHVKVVCK